MRYLALATDYDGTLARDGHVDESILSALERFRDSGRRLILVTGRELDELLEIFPRIGLFDRVVAENGALLYRPDGREEMVLGEPPPPALVEAIRKRGVAPLSIGRSIIATVEPHQGAVLDAIREVGLEWQVIFNKGSVMVLPSGINKAVGLSAALEELNLAPRNVVAVGDAENDHAFLSLCEFAAAVANALPMLKERADFVTRQSHGQGVVELIDQVLADDLEGLSRCLSRHSVVLGTRASAAAIPASMPRASVGPERSFHFRGPEGKLDLRAQNLNLFLQLADGVDDETWMFHLRQGDYSRWFRHEIKDADLADVVERIERPSEVSPKDSRAAIREAVERRSTLPSEPADSARAAEAESKAESRPAPGR